MIQLQALNSTGIRIDDSCLDGSTVSSLGAFYGIGREGEGDCLAGSLYC